ncbi:hypothetical protein RRG08_002558 [Elysia crispata]|uniref:Peptidase A2 domain-containing protein n=1 Tax=Elysia crispata TaxID=231223 RepID=A0AAE0Y661_9GAST|nr:hypothetical protein RRG08_002558 [Elysia crispata]
MNKKDVLLGCRTKAVHDIAQPRSTDNSDSEDDFNIGSVTHENKDGSEVFYKADVEGVNITFKVDTGAQVNIIPHHLMQDMQYELLETKARLKTYTGTAITVMGKTDLTVNGQNHEFYVVEEKHLTPILGYASAKKLEVIKIMSLTAKEYPTIFKGLGYLKKPTKFKSTMI